MKTFKRVSDATYKLMLQSMPIATVDLVVVRGQGKNQEFLLGRRANNPYRGKWFIPGGRILRGETLDQAVKRQLKQELGIRGGKATFVTHLCLNNPPANVGARYYTILHVYKVQVASGTEAKRDSENFELGWFKRIDPTWPSPVKRIVRELGFK